MDDQSEDTTDRQEPTRAVMRRPLTALLPPFSSRKPDIWRWRTYHSRVRPDLTLILILQILFHSLEREYVLTNLPWLIGSLGTMAEDAVIFVQFRIFKNGRGDDVAVA
jgi:hypothetical protein